MYPVNWFQVLSKYLPGQSIYVHIGFECICYDKKKPQEELYLKERIRKAKDLSYAYKFNYFKQTSLLNDEFQKT